MNNESQIKAILNSTQKGERFPDWEKLYQEVPTETLPWYFQELDPDLKEALSEMNIHDGLFLDIGTGPGTQAMQLAKRGFKVTGADISALAIKKASALFPEIQFFVDDILKTGLQGPYDYAFDRGCFHVIQPELRPGYVQSLRTILKKGGILFLKCFSLEQEPKDLGPFLFSPHDIKTTFYPHFELISLKHSVYHGTLESNPKALFSALRLLR